MHLWCGGNTVQIHCMLLLQTPPGLQCSVTVAESAKYCSFIMPSCGMFHTLYLTSMPKTLLRWAFSHLLLSWSSHPKEIAFRTSGIHSMYVYAVSQYGNHSCIGMIGLFGLLQREKLSTPATTKRFPTSYSPICESFVVPYHQLPKGCVYILIGSAASYCFCIEWQASIMWHCSYTLQQWCCLAAGPVKPKGMKRTSSVWGFPHQSWRQWNSHQCCSVDARYGSNVI